MEVTSDRLATHYFRGSDNTSGYFGKLAITTSMPRSGTNVFSFAERCSPNHTPEANKKIVLSSTSGTINTPLLSTHNLECHWTITVPSGHRIKLSFSIFHLGATEAQADCEKVDHVKVRDGKGNDPALGTFCGNVAPSPMYSVGPMIEITFVSNEDKVLQGFSARFESISGGKLMFYFGLNNLL